jgi:cytochrome oxidase Cu insertion factor (SCO1/SenC/PrrC family)
MSQSNNPALQQQRKNPYALWFVILAFFGPALLAYGWYFFGNVSAHNNQGEILNPIIDVEAMQLSLPGGKPMTRDEASYNRWNMMYFVGASCDASCNTVLHEMRQINKAIGKNAYRVRHMIVHTALPDAAFTNLLEAEYPDAIRLHAAMTTLQSVMLEVSPDPNAQVIYLMDPIGNVMMRFKQDLPPKALINDLNKLLKISQIG